VLAVLIYEDKSLKEVVLSSKEALSKILTAS